MRSHRTISVVPIPRYEPDVISADEAWVAEPRSPYVQGTLATVFADDDRFFDPQPTGSRSLPPPETFLQSVGQALVEVMWGLRPAPQLVRWTTPDVYAVLARRSLVASRRTGSPRASRPTTGRTPLIRRIRVCEPADGVAEASLVVVIGDRARAMAVRMEGLDGRWVITELLVG